ncbi:MAG: hypothetical protein K6B74_08810 [Ruminococcus sp.]|nr:hypothetical protein [Ruminococcus sp.]
MIPEDKREKYFTFAWDGFKLYKCLFCDFRGSIYTADRCRAFQNKEKAVGKGERIGKKDRTLSVVDNRSWHYLSRDGSTPLIYSHHGIVGEIS